MTSPNIEVGYYNESRFTRPRPTCPNPGHWHTRDIQATEIEVVDMVHGMIRGLQPDVVLETGTSRGFMTFRIAQALLQNDHGVVVTFEPDPAVRVEALENWGDHPARDVISSCDVGSLDVQWTGGPIDFAWHDSLLELRVPEFDYYLPFYSNRAVVCFHDTAPKFGSWSNELRQRLQEEGFSWLDMPTPRGCIVARRNL